MKNSCNIDITHVISDQVSGNLTIVKSILAATDPQKKVLIMLDLVSGS